MKIVLVGALSHDNFGDVLFANIFYSMLLKKHPKEDIYIYEFPLSKLSVKCREELNYKNKCNLFDLLNADILIYISGGYFVNKQDRFFENLRWYTRYVLPGIIMSRRKKEIYVLGVGGGKIRNKLCQKKVSSVLNCAKYITVRNKETKKDFEDIGVTGDIILTTDTAQISTTLFPGIHEKVFQDFFSDCPLDKKIILLHITPFQKINSLICQSIIPALNRFLSEHNEYGVVVTFDGYAPEKYSFLLIDIYNRIICENKFIYNYEHSLKLCGLINSCSMIVTPKLHVGIVGASLGKSVIAFPINDDKTNRYYKNIGFENRCRALTGVSSVQAYAMFKEFHDKEIQIPKEIYEKAWLNLAYVDRI